VVTGETWGGGGGRGGRVPRRKKKHSAAQGVSKRSDALESNQIDKKKRVREKNAGMDRGRKKRDLSFHDRRQTEKKPKKPRRNPKSQNSKGFANVEGKEALKRASPHASPIKKKKIPLIPNLRAHRNISKSWKGTRELDSPSLVRKPHRK